MTRPRTTDDDLVRLPREHVVPVADPPLEPARGPSDIEAGGGWMPASVAAVRGLSARVLVPVVATGLVALLATEPLEGSVLALLAFICAAFIVPARPAWAALLPLMRAPLQLLMPIVGVAALVGIEAATSLPGLGADSMLLLLGVTSVVALVPYAGSLEVWRSQGAVRTAVIGSARSARDLQRELRVAGIPDYVIVGRVSVTPSDGEPAVDFEVPLLGSLEELGGLVEAHRLNLLVMTSEVPRFTVFDQVSQSVLHLPVRLWELSGFYEDVFGHVPVAEINSAWFQYIAHPKYRAVAPSSKRALDVVVALVMALLFAPLLAILAPLIRRDGGPVFFRQVRIGEGGQSLTVYKLRTMAPTASVGAQWAEADDPRVTGIGRLLRRAHLDELPQLMNVLRGEMSLVGPRPEQPDFVDQLEEVLPFYQRRHLMKPGITGWAQVRCGYAGSDVGSAWKLSHDLYYLKHRSIAFDFAILGETVRTLVADRRYAIEPKWVSFIHGDEAPAPEALRSRIASV
jgi:exopolysaccharide biosynthesis polyprenyl glycosylphosphotransferase